MFTVEQMELTIKVDELGSWLYIRPNLHDHKIDHFVDYLFKTIKTSLRHQNHKSRELPGRHFHWLSKSLWTMFRLQADQRCLYTALFIHSTKKPWGWPPFAKFYILPALSCSRTSQSTGYYLLDGLIKIYRIVRKSTLVRIGRNSILELPFWAHTQHSSNPGHYSHQVITEPLLFGRVLRGWQLVVMYRYGSKICEIWVYPSGGLEDIAVVSKNGSEGAQAATSKTLPRDRLNAAQLIEQTNYKSRGEG